MVGFPLKHAFVHAWKMRLSYTFCQVEANRQPVSQGIVFYRHALCLHPYLKVRFATLLTTPRSFDILLRR